MAGAQNKKKKGQKKRALKAATSGPDVRVNSHVSAITVVIFTTKVFFAFFFYSCFVQISIHSCVRTAVDFGGLRNFQLTQYIYIYVYFLYLIYLVF